MSNIFIPVGQVQIGDRIANFNGIVEASWQWAGGQQGIDLVTPEGFEVTITAEAGVRLWVNRPADVPDFTQIMAEVPDAAI